MYTSGASPPIVGQILAGVHDWFEKTMILQVHIPLHKCHNRLRVGGEVEMWVLGILTPVPVHFKETVHYDFLP